MITPRTEAEALGKHSRTFRVTLFSLCLLLSTVMLALYGSLLATNAKQYPYAQVNNTNADLGAIVNRSSVLDEVQVEQLSLPPYVNLGLTQFCTSNSTRFKSNDGSVVCEKYDTSDVHYWMNMQHIYTTILNRELKGSGVNNGSFSPLLRATDIIMPATLTGASKPATMMGCPLSNEVIASLVFSCLALLTATYGVLVSLNPQRWKQSDIVAGVLLVCFIAAVFVGTAPFMGDVKGMGSTLNSAFSKESQLGISVQGSSGKLQGLAAGAGCTGLLGMVISAWLIVSL